MKQEVDTVKHLQKENKLLLAKLTSAHTMIEDLRSLDSLI